jgi:hypothetical protein
MTPEDHGQARYRLCWPRLLWIRQAGSRFWTHGEVGRVIGAQILWRRSQEIDDAF